MNSKNFCEHIRSKPTFKKVDSIAISENGPG